MNPEGNFYKQVVKDVVNAKRKMSHRSLRTSLLNAFAHLSAREASFTEGDLVVDDQDGSLFKELCEQGAALPSRAMWWELALPAPPLAFLCPCFACGVRNDTKQAVRFRQHHDSYVVIRLMQHSVFTSNGMMEHARLALWGAPPTADGCTGGYRSTDAERYDTRSKLIDEALHTKYNTMEDLRQYNRNHRICNELYLPKPCWTDDPNPRR
jgi:hypothetical protein